MKKISIAIISLFFSCQGVFAQTAVINKSNEEPKTIADAAKKATDQLGSSIHSLSSEQYTAVYNYFYEVLSKTQEAPARAGRNPIGQTISSLTYFGSANTAFFRERDEKLKTILTPEQWKQLKTSESNIK